MITRTLNEAQGNEVFILRETYENSLIFQHYLFCLCLYPVAQSMAQKLILVGSDVFLTKKDVESVL